MILLLLLLSTAAFVFFTIRYLQLRSTYKSMSVIEKRYDSIQTSRDQQHKKANNILTKTRNTLKTLGLKNDLFPLAAIFSFGYIMVALALTTVGLSELQALLASLPIILTTLWAINSTAKKRRKKKFNQQMITLLDLVAAQVQSGLGAERAVIAVTPNLPDPIRSEFSAAVLSAEGGGDLLEALHILENRYPSRAFTMFLSALEIDRSDGATIAPALQQASAIMKDNFTLQAEAAAELSSVKAEFIGVFILLALIAYSVVTTEPPEGQRSVWTTPMGIIVLVACLANGAIGWIRFKRLTDRIEKETE